uniref:Putative secreted protein n=1 Tax=Anopheles darlingi TaxID=43151 RepID=A0A2M4DBS9_ANODA
MMLWKLLLVLLYGVLVAGRTVRTELGVNNEVFRWSVIRAALITASLYRTPHILQFSGQIPVLQYFGLP